jgi:hypothetical protein
MYKDQELWPFLFDPHKQTLIDLQYFVEERKENGHEVLILMNENQAEKQTYQPQMHNIKLVTQRREFMLMALLIDHCKALCTIVV